MGETIMDALCAVALATIVAVGAGGCAKKPDGVVVGVTTDATANISEFCYKGVVYLMNVRGGMSPKMLDAGLPFTGSSTARVETCK
jgi:hypothetical protein